MIRSVATGVGSYLPERVMTNAELSEMVDTSDDWIVARSGIRQRHIAAEGQTTSDLAVAAAQAAMANAGVGPEDIDLIILATATPDHTFPATATQVQERLGVRQGAAFDIQAVCSGFIYALTTADNFLKAGQHKRALVIGAETFSRILDWTDRTTCVLFGDGAGALVLEAQEGQGTADDSRCADNAPAFRWPVQGYAVCGWRAVGDTDRGPFAHAGARGVQARGDQSGRRDP